MHNNVINYYYDEVECDKCNYKFCIVCKLQHKNIIHYLQLFTIFDDYFPGFICALIYIFVYEQLDNY